MDEENKKPIEVEAEKIEVIEEKTEQEKVDKEETQQEEAPQEEAPQENSQNGRGISIAALVLGIVCLVSNYGRITCGILAIIFGSIGIKKDGNKMARAGLIMGIIGIAIWLLILIGWALVAWLGLASLFIAPF